MGCTFPRVTHILADVGLGPDFSRARHEDLERGRIRGTLVHQAVEALTYNYFEPDAYTEIAGYIAAFQRFVREAKYVPLGAELEVIHDVWRYQGHPDALGWLGTARALLDFKSGEADGVEYQLAAYFMAYNHQHPQEPVTVAACVELRENGTYRLDPVDLADATPIWLAAVTIFHARQRRAA